MKNLIYIKNSEIKELRENLLKKQNYICPLCGEKIDPNKAVLDHQHRQKKTDEVGVNDDGLIRGVLCNNCNQIEGKITSALKRFKNIHLKNEKIDFLKKLIYYYDNYITEYVHPTEKIPRKKVSKRNFNQLKKVCNKEIEYPKSGYLTKPLQKLFEKYGINPYNEL